VLTTLQIGDFGNAEQTHLADPRNPQDVRAPGLPDTAAPEQITEGDHETGMLLSSKTNIWSCGRIALAAMGASTLEARDLDFVADLSPYSSTLQALALRCLRTDPADRPSPEELLKEIRNHVEHVPSRPTEWWRLLDQRMRNLVRGLMGVPLPARDELSMKWRSPMIEKDRLDAEVDNYRLGFVDATMGRAGNFM
jgi:serine/threonine protein kinase